MTTKHQTLAQVRAAVVAGYVTGAAVMLWPAARLASGHTQGVAPHIVDALIMLAAAFWLQKRRSIIAAVILLVFSVILSYFRYLSGGNILILGLGLLLAAVFFNGVRATRLLRVQGFPAASAGR
jgi:hypothetical protein